MPMDDRQQKSMGELAALMYEDPEMKPVIDTWAEKSFPGVHSRMVATKAVQAIEQRVDKKAQEFDAKLAVAEAKRTREEAIAKIQADPKLRIRPDEVPDIEKLMLERHIGTYEDGAISFRARNHIAEPRSAVGSYSMQVPGLSGAGGDETAWLSPVFKSGMDRSVLDRVTRDRVDQITRDFAAGRGSRWE